MKKKQKLLAAGLSILGLFAFESCRKTNPGTSEKKNNTVILKLAHNLNEKHTVHIALEKFAQLVSERTDNQIQIQIFPNGQLGGESEELEQMKVGAIAMTKVSAAALTTYDDGYNAFTLPYIFTDENHYYKCMDSDAVKQLYTDTHDKGFIGLTFYDSGARSFYTKSKPILKPVDLQGLKVRVMGYQSQTDMIRALGGTPVSMAYGEVYTALQSGVIDGAESNETALTIGRHGEVAKCFSYDEHTRIPDILVISSKVWDKLTPDQQQIIKKAAVESTEYHKGLWKESIAAAKNEAETTMGVKFYNVDKTPFREAVQPVIEKYREKMPEVKTLLDAFKDLEQQ